jgi:hypothetical protein
MLVVGNIRQRCIAHGNEDQAMRPAVAQTETPDALAGGRSSGWLRPPRSCARRTGDTPVAVHFSERQFLNRHCFGRQPDTWKAPRRRPDASSTDAPSTDALKLRRPPGLPRPLTPSATRGISPSPRPHHFPKKSVFIRANRG